MVTPFSAIYEQSRGAGSSDGEVQQKIAGTFRSDAGATSFCRIRSYLSTMHKQGHSMLAALAAVFAGKPLPVAWAPM